MVTVHFDSGHPTTLPHFPRLACLVALLGQPSRVERIGGRYVAKWGDIVATFPAWPGDRRKVIFLAVTPEAYRAAERIALAAADAASAALCDAERAAESARSAYRAAEDAWHRARSAARRSAYCAIESEQRGAAERAK
jgi:hypothetical protein